ncbi:unnamed protein product [Paramecium sonneborni]|uniref:Uncharacterized protein n=1 Tax=Paramecium sonneborni TaxID=65129 RepID=A0A8S1NXZ2_9CILI|nr:unnamed protein product [Paramecium sonneborni]
MSLGKRQLSGSKLKFDADYYKNVPDQLQKKRPGSGQPQSTITSPLPPRKPVYSGKLRNIIPTSENVNQQQRIIKTSNSQQKQQLNPSVSQSQLPGVVNSLKINKPPLQLDRKLILPKQNTSSQISIKSSQVSNQISTGEKKIIQKLIEKPGTLTSPGLNDKQFTWNNQIELIVTQSDFENKRRQISHEKLKQIPNKHFQQQQTIDQKKPTQPIIQQTQQSHIVVPQHRQFIQPQQIQKKQDLNLKQLKNSQSQTQLQTSQPKCFIDFTMTSGKNDLQQIFQSMKMELKEASSYGEQHPNLNMSEIQEQSDDANSSLAQSTLYQK